MLASVIGASPMAMIRYQYTAVMIAPIVIAAIEGAAGSGVPDRPTSCGPVAAGMGMLDQRRLVPVSVGAGYSTWVTTNPRVSALQAALGKVPDDASVSATYTPLPHLAHRGRSTTGRTFKAAYWATTTVTSCRTRRRSTTRRRSPTDRPERQTCSPSSPTATPSKSCSIATTSSLQTGARRS